MPKRKVTPKNARKCLMVVAEIIEEFGVDAKHLCQRVDRLLDELVAEDAFGTEGQCDPRGDRRDD